MKTYEDAVEFHADVLDLPMWTDHHRVSVDFLIHAARNGRMLTSAARAESARLLTQSGMQLENKDYKMSDPGLPASLAQSTVTKVKQCATLWVDPDLLDLPDIDPNAVENPGLPAVHQIPFADGAVMLFGKEVEVPHPTREDETLTVVGACWYPVLSMDPGSNEPVWKAAMYSFVRDKKTRMLTLDLSSLWTLGSEAAPSQTTHLMKEVDDGVIDNGANQSVLIAKIMRFLAMGSDEDMEQTSIAVTDASHDKGAKRAAKKRGVTTDVNVIYLNRNKRKVLRDDTGRKDSHGVRRHMVRGFWRRQPYGPKRALRKWVYVAAHERGTKGDLDERPKVYVGS